MAEQLMFIADNPKEEPAKAYDPEEQLEVKDRVAIGDIVFSVTDPYRSYIPVSKTVGTNLPIVMQLPFHLGFIEDTAGSCKAILNPDTTVSDDTDVIIFDLPSSPTTAEHFILIGYSRIEAISAELLDILRIDTKRDQLRTFRTDVKSLSTWLDEYPEDHSKPFSGEVTYKEETHGGIKTGDIPLSYSFINGHKVYKASILGTITESNTSWRKLCDVITFMEVEDICILYISSGGGDTQTASSIITAIEQSAGTVVTLACGPCASAAPVLWSKGNIRLMTDNASMMVHNIAITDTATKTASHLVDLGEFTTSVAKTFLTETVGHVGLATEEEIETVVSTSKEYYHPASVVQARTKAVLVRTDKDIWRAIDAKL